MNAPFYKCEDCGHEFEKTDFFPDIEDALVSCPVCDGLDIQLVEEPAPAQGAQAA